MKRIIAYIIVLALCFTVFTACDTQQPSENETPTEAPVATEVPVEEDDSLERASDYLHMIYKDSAVKTPRRLSGCRGRCR